MDRSPCKRATVDLLNELSDCGNLATGIPPGAGYNYLGSAPVGAVNGAGVSVKEYGFGNYRTTVFTLSSVKMALTGVASTVAYTSQKIYDFPVGHIYIQSAVADLTLTADAAGVNNDWDGDFGLGTAAAAGDATLTNTEDDILPTTAVAAGTDDKIGVAKGASTVNEHVVLNGSSTAKGLYLNALVDNDNQDVTSTPTNLIAAGTITLNWIFMGDN